MDPTSPLSADRHQSPDESVTASHGASANRQDIRFSDKFSWIAFAILLVVALLIIVDEKKHEAEAEATAVQVTEQLAKAQRDNATELQLRRYNLDWFRAHEFAELEVRVGVLERTQEMSYGRRRNHHPAERSGETGGQ